LSQELGYPITCIGIPKTVDNDLPFTDNCPGFGSVAKYVAVSILEASLDVASMAASSTKVFIMEVMGRHAGWIAASAGLAQTTSGGAPHIILFPEVAFKQKEFLQKVQATVKTHGYCVIVVSEGTRHENGQFLAESGLKDAFGHAQLGGVAPFLAQMIKSELGLKNHWAVSDYLQRAARHIASSSDVEQAYALGKSAVELAIAGKNAVMPIVVRDSDSPYRWHIEDIPLAKVANVEKKLPKEFISADGYGISDACRKYLAPLILGEAYPPYENGLPQYVTIPHDIVAKKLKESFAVA
jgi:6-phosphofructokinase 1